MNSTSELAELLETMVLDFRDTLSQEMVKLRNMSGDEMTSGEHIRELTNVLKLIQGVELISNGVRQQREQYSNKQLEVVEFRRELEAQIARLIDNEPPVSVPGTTSQ